MTNADDIARLKAEAAEAAAEAAAAKAAAAQAKLEAALAAAGENPAEANENSEAPKAAAEKSTKKSDIPTAEKPTTKNISNAAKDIQDAYNFDVDTITIGTYMESGSPIPGVTINAPLKMLNRHGLIAGATGSGKTRTLQLFAESLADQGVSVFVTDIKGDLTGIAEAGQANEKLSARTTANGQNWEGRAHTVDFINLGGNGIGAPVRTTVTDMGPLLLARILELNETQESCLQLVFNWADSQNLPLVDLSDLRALFTYLTSDEGKAELATIGGVSKATAGVILRQISALESSGAKTFFGEPAFDTRDLIRTNTDGTGIITALELPNVAENPKLLSTFVMWLLADLFTDLPEVGDQDKPKLVFFFDEAHLLFADASKAFLDAVVRTVRLIRSKGVGIFFITQTAKDIPADVLGQLGTRVQHVLRAFTPQDQKAIKATVETFPKTSFDLAETLTNLGTGEAIVTVLNAKGAPTPVAVTKIWAPAGVMGEASQASVDAMLAGSPLKGRYDNVVDPESAYEILTKKMAAADQAKADAAAAKEAEKQAALEAKEAAKAEREAARAAANNPMNKMLGTMLSTATRAVTYQVVRSIFGTRRR